MLKTFAELKFPGRLIAVEGLDGSGKSTQIYLLKRWLENQGLKVYFSEWNSSELVKAATSKGKKRELLTPGSVYKVVLPNLMTSNVFGPGHRIRVQISATFFPGFSRNLHTGELETVSGKMRTATVRIHHDKEHPSRILVPLIPPAPVKQD